MRWWRRGWGERTLNILQRLDLRAIVSTSSNMPTRIVVLLSVLLLLVCSFASCTPEEELGRRADQLRQTTVAAVQQTAEAAAGSLQGTAESTISTAIPRFGASDPHFTALPIAAPHWTNGFGAILYAEKNWKTDYKGTSGLHGGIDFGAPATTQILAGLHGWVGGASGDATPNVRVTSGEYVVTFGHVDRDSKLKDGEEVKPDTIIGTVHDQGDNSHLHVSVRKSDRFYNPLYFFEQSLIESYNWGPYSDT
jgi:murein DD-endopeptidase MepM/ murein hydrolase activator NlpD